jgi:hypothetical protein
LPYTITHIVFEIISYTIDSISNNKYKKKRRFGNSIKANSILKLKTIKNMEKKV